MSPELRALIDAEIQRGLSHSALSSRPKLRQHARDLIADIVERIVARSTTVVDPQSGLDLLADAPHVYRNRVKDFGTKLTAQAFLERVWGDYTRRHLLYAEHLRAIDMPLYAALQYRAAVLPISQSDYMLSLGIMSRDHINNPPGGYHRQANILRLARNRLRARRMNATIDAKITDSNR